MLQDGTKQAVLVPEITRGRRMEMLRRIEPVKESEGQEYSGWKGATAGNEADGKDEWRNVFPEDLVLLAAAVERTAAAQASPQEPMQYLLSGSYGGVNREAASSWKSLDNDFIKIKFACSEELLQAFNSVHQQGVQILVFPLRAAEVKV